jgi:putative salt-induced outer membrane protein
MGSGGLGMKYFTKIILLGTLLLTSSVYAQDAAEEGPELGWSGSGEFGLVNTTGNTESFALNLKLDFIKTTELWRYRFGATALHTSENSVKDNQRYQIEAQADRKLGEKSWLFGVYRYDADKFGAYDPSQTFTAGYGRQLMKSEKHSLKGEIGGGYRKLKNTVGGETSSDAIVRFLLDDQWQVLKTTKWTNRLLVETGSNNTFTQFNTGVAVSMTDKFAVKVGFELRNNSELPPGDSENTDTITTVNLVYGF